MNDSWWKACRASSRRWLEACYSHMTLSPDRYLIYFFYLVTLDLDCCYCVQYMLPCIWLFYCSILFYSAPLCFRAPNMVQLSNNNYYIYTYEKRMNLWMRGVIFFFQLWWEWVHMVFPTRHSKGRHWDWQDLPLLEINYHTTRDTGLGDVLYFWDFEVHLKDLMCLIIQCYSVENTVRVKKKTIAWSCSGG